MVNICLKCNRVKLRCEEEIFVHIVLLDDNKDFIGRALENSYRKHVCRIC